MVNNMKIFQLLKIEYSAVATTLGVHMLDLLFTQLIVLSNVISTE